MLVNKLFGNRQGAIEPQVFIEDIGQGQKSFDTVHIAVGSAIGLAVTPVASKAFQQGAFCLGPEIAFKNGHRIAQQLGRTTAPGHRCRAGGQRDKGMQIGRFARVAVLRAGAGKPAAMHGITQRPGQCGQAVVDQRRATGQALNMGQGKTVHHACGGDGVCRGVVRAATKRVERGEAAGHAGGLGEIHQRLALIAQPLLMGRRCQPAFVGPG